MACTLGITVGRARLSLQKGCDDFVDARVMVLIFGLVGMIQFMLNRVHTC